MGSEQKPQGFFVPMEFMCFFQEVMYYIFHFSSENYHGTPKEIVVLEINLNLFERVVGLGFILVLGGGKERLYVFY